jgi:hypothetical protein
MNGRRDDRPALSRFDFRPPRAGVLGSAPWAVVFAGLAIMVVLLVVAITSAPVERGMSDDSPVLGLPAVPTTTPPVVTGGDLASLAPPGTAAPSPAAPTSSSPVPPTWPDEGGAPPATAPGTEPDHPVPSVVQPPKPAEVTGRYRLLDSYGDSFIAEVLIGNVTSGERQWTVQLQFPADVGDLRTSWVEGAPQATLRRSGSTYVWTSTVALAGGSSVPLRFQFNRTGTTNTPSTCVTNGTRCSGF